MRLSETVTTLAAAILRRPDWAGVLRQQTAGAGLQIAGGRDLRKVFEAVRADFRKGRTAHALALCRAAAFVDAALFIREARRHGLFRCSKVLFRSEPVMHTVDSLVADGNALQWLEEHLAYLRSVSCLLALGPSVRALRRSVVASLIARRHVVIMSCMVHVDRAFRPSADHRSTEGDQMAAATGHPDYFSPEQKAAGLSTIVSLMQEVVGWNRVAATDIDEEGIADGTFDRLLQEAARLGRFFDAEEQLDAFPYAAEPFEGRTDAVLVRATDLAFEKSMQLGFIHQFSQAHRAQWGIEDEQQRPVPSLAEAAQRFFAQLGQEVVIRKELPVDRYVMYLPLAPPVRAMMNDQGLYREEALYLHRLARDAFMSLDQLSAMPLAGGWDPLESTCRHASLSIL